MDSLRQGPCGNCSYCPTYRASNYQAITLFCFCPCQSLTQLVLLDLLLLTHTHISVSPIYCATTSLLLDHRLGLGSNSFSAASDLCPPVAWFNPSTSLKRLLDDFSAKPWHPVDPTSPPPPPTGQSAAKADIKLACSACLSIDTIVGTHQHLIFRTNNPLSVE